MISTISRWALAVALCAATGCSGGPQDVPPPKDYKGPLPKAGAVPIGGQPAPQKSEQKPVKPES